MCGCRFSRFTSCWRFCTTTWPPHPPDMAPDPHDDWDFEGPDTCSLLDEFMAKMSQSVNNDYKNLHALLETLPDSTHPQ